MEKGEEPVSQGSCEINIVHSHSFTQPIVIKHLLCTKCYTRHRGYRGAPSLPLGAGVLVSETDLKQISQLPESKGVISALKKHKAGKRGEKMNRGVVWVVIQPRCQGRPC